jgi:hypothetical protein
MRLALVGRRVSIYIQATTQCYTANRPTENATKQPSQKEKKGEKETEIAAKETNIKKK